MLRMSAEKRSFIAKETLPEDRNRHQTHVQETD
jgi:hypothetical protein